MHVLITIEAIKRMRGGRVIKGIIKAEKTVVDEDGAKAVEHQ